MKVETILLVALVSAIMMGSIFSDASVWAQKKDATKE